MDGHADSNGSSSWEKPHGPGDSAAACREEVARACGTWLNTRNTQTKGPLGHRDGAGVVRNPRWILLYFLFISLIASGTVTFCKVQLGKEGSQQHVKLQCPSADLRAGMRALI